MECGEDMKNNFYCLYRFRKTHSKYPSDYVGIQINNEHSWLIIGRPLQIEEVAYYDVEEHGLRMTYKEYQEFINNY